MSFTVDLQTFQNMIRMIAQGYTQTLQKQLSNVYPDIDQHLTQDIIDAAMTACLSHSLPSSDNKVVKPVVKAEEASKKQPTNQPCAKDGCKVKNVSNSDHVVDDKYYCHTHYKTALKAASNATKATTSVTSVTSVASVAPQEEKKEAKAKTLNPCAKDGCSVKNVLALDHVLDGKYYCSKHWESISKRAKAATVIPNTETVVSSATTSSVLTSPKKLVVTSGNSNFDFCTADPVPFASDKNFWALGHWGRPEQQLAYNETTSFVFNFDPNRAAKEGFWVGMVRGGNIVHVADLDPVIIAWAKASKLPGVETLEPLAEDPLVQSMSQCSIHDEHEEKQQEDEEDDNAAWSDAEETQEEDNQYTFSL